MVKGGRVNMWGFKKIKIKRYLLLVSGSEFSIPWIALIVGVVLILAKIIFWIVDFIRFL